MPYIYYNIILAQDRRERIDGILKTTVKVLAEKGYENATIADISKAANVARGALHYYFRSKEDLVTNALTNSTNDMIKSSLEGLKGVCAEEVADNVVNIHKKNISQNSEFYSFLFEMWCAGRRSRKIKKEFIACQGKVTNAIREWLETASKQGILKINLNESETLAMLLLGIADGTAFELIDHPEKLNDKKTWLSLKKMILAVLKE
jgi:AcrR family transcriptional regulator